MVYQLPSPAAHDDVVAAQLPDKTVIFQWVLADGSCPQYTSAAFENDSQILSYKTEEYPDGRLVVKPIFNDSCLVQFYDTTDASECIRYKINYVVEECIVDYIFLNSEYLPIWNNPFSKLCLIYYSNGGSRYPTLQY